MSAACILNEIQNSFTMEANTINPGPYQLQNKPRGHLIYLYVTGVVFTINVSHLPS